MTTTSATPGGSRGYLNSVLWTLQILLAIAFTVAGAAKFLIAPNQLADAPGWEGHMLMLRVIGLSELLGAAGLVIPSVTRIYPRLTPLAALSLTVVMLLAVGVHLGRHEYGEMLVPIGLVLLLGAVCWGRGRTLPIRPRQTGGGR